jgi:lipopolysaccharide export system permease protein
MGLLLGTLFTFDKLSKDSELTIFRAVGISFKRIITPLLVLSSIVTALCFITYDKLIPISCKKLQDIKGGTVNTQFIYTRKDENNHPKEAVIVSKFHNNIMYDVIVMDFDNQIYKDLHGLERVYIADTGVLSKTKDGEPCWDLRDVTVYTIDDNGVFKHIQKIRRKTILDGKVADNAYTIMINSTKRDRELENKDLLKYISLLKKENLDEEYRLYLNKYLQRFLHPFVCIILAILGAILGFSKPREQRLIGFVIAIGFIFAYYVTLPFFDYLAEKGVFHPIITAAFPLVAFIAAIIVFYKSRDL